MIVRDVKAQLAHIVKEVLPKAISDFVTDGSLPSAVELPPSLLVRSVIPAPVDAAPVTSPAPSSSSDGPPAPVDAAPVAAEPQTVPLVDAPPVSDPDDPGWQAVAATRAEKRRAAKASHAAAAVPLTRPVGVASAPGRGDGSLSSRGPVMTPPVAAEGLGVCEPRAQAAAASDPGPVVTAAPAAFPHGDPAGAGWQVVGAKRRAKQA